MIMAIRPAAQTADVIRSMLRFIDSTPLRVTCGRDQIRGKTAELVHDHM
jgi:hypothetical protein